MNLKHATKSEDTEQIAVIQWARNWSDVHPELKLLHHCPNGGKRNRQEAVKLKQMGVLSGVPDLHLPVSKGAYAGLYIEMKYDKGTIQKSQKEFLHAAAGTGNFCVVCYSAQEAVDIIDEYIHLIPGATMSHPNEAIYKSGRVLPL